MSSDLTVVDMSLVTDNEMSVVNSGSDASLTTSGSDEESWVELSSQRDRQTPPMVNQSSDEYIRLLREAQRESDVPSSAGQPSARVSIASSRKHSPIETPNSPSTPYPESSTESEDLSKGFYINRELASTEITATSDWVRDYSSRPDRHPPQEWNFKHPQRQYSLRRAKVGKRSLFSREVISVLLFTNCLSVMIGAGIGWIVCRRLSNTDPSEIPGWLFKQ